MATTKSSTYSTNSSSSVPQDQQLTSDTLSRYTSPEAIEQPPNLLKTTSTDEAQNSSKTSSLSPVHTPLAILPTYIRQSKDEITLRLTCHIHHQYTVKADPSGEKIFHIDIHGAFHKVRTIYDAKLDIALLELRDQHGTKSLQTSVMKLHTITDSGHPTHIGEERDGKFLGEFENAAAVSTPKAAKIGGKYAHVHGLSSIYVRDDRIEGWAMIGTSVIRSHVDDQIIATVHRSNELSEHEYTVTIAPGVDLSLIVAFCVSMDHKWAKEKRWVGEQRVDSGIDMSHDRHMSKH